MKLGFYSKDLFSNTNKAFTKSYIEKWNNIYPNLQSSLFLFIDEYNTIYGNAINNSRQLDSIRWNRTNNTVDSDIQTIKTWLSKRIEWINNNINNL